MQCNFGSANFLHNTEENYNYAFVYHSCCGSLSILLSRQHLQRWKMPKVFFFFFILNSVRRSSRGMRFRHGEFKLGYLNGQWKEAGHEVDLNSINSLWVACLYDLLLIKLIILYSFHVKAYFMHITWDWALKWLKCGTRKLLMLYTETLVCELCSLNAST